MDGGEAAVCCVGSNDISGASWFEPCKYFEVELDYLRKQMITCQFTVTEVHLVGGEVEGSLMWFHLSLEDNMQYNIVQRDVITWQGFPSQTRTCKRSQTKSEGSQIK